MRPWAVIDPGDGRSGQPDPEDREALAAACAELGIPILAFSSALVFDGLAGRPYRESDPVTPDRPDGEREAASERSILAANARALVIRAGVPFGPWSRDGFLWPALARLHAGEIVEADREIVSPAYLPDLAHAALDLLIDGADGIWHLAHDAEVSWAEFAALAAERAATDPGRIETGSDDGAHLNRALATERGLLLPPLESALDRFVRDSAARWRGDSMNIAAE
jgi:dTDP-4-dehydrorhamnose reductase